MLLHLCRFARRRCQGSASQFWNGIRSAEDPAHPPEFVLADNDVVHAPGAAVGDRRQEITNELERAQIRRPNDPEVQIDSDWEELSELSDTTASTTESRTSTIGRDMKKVFANLADRHTRLSQTIMQNLCCEATPLHGDPRASKLRLCVEILGNPNIDEANKARVQSVMASLLQAEMDAINADADNS